MFKLLLRKMKSLILVLMLVALFVQGEEPKVYSVILYHKANPPYSYFNNNVRAGIFHDIFKEISKLSGLKFKFVMFSVARGKIQFNQGKADIEPGVNIIWRENEAVPGLFSISYAYSREVILAVNEPYTDDVTKLYGEVVGKVRGYRHGAFEKHFGDDKIITNDNTSERLLIEQLYNKRFKYILIGEATAAYYAHAFEKYSNFTVAYEISKTPVSMRINPKHPQLLEQVNAALETMIADGTITNIYRKYGYVLKPLSEDE